MKKFLDDLKKETLEQKWNYYRVPLYVSTTSLRVLRKVGDVVCTPKISRAKEAMTGDKLVMLFEDHFLSSGNDDVIHLFYSNERMGGLHDRQVESNGFAAFVVEKDFDEKHKITNQEMVDYCSEFENSAYNRILSTYAKKEKGKEKVKK